MTVLGFIPSPRVQTRRRQPPLHKGVRAALTGAGVVVMAVAVPLTLMPFVHAFGLLLFAVGLVIVLRNSFGARREFIKAQRRHPNLVHPLRRLIRRKPEVIPVIWHLTLKSERLILPARWRIWRRLRRKLSRRRAS